MDSTGSEVRVDSVANATTEDRVGDKLIEMVYDSVLVTLAALEIVVEATCERLANVVEMTLDATTLAVRKAPSPRSILSKAASPLGKNLVHQNAMRIPRSTKRCFKIKATTKKKKQTVDNMSRRSNQSDFSRAVIRCFEVPITASSVSWVEEVDRRVAVEESEAM